MIERDQAALGELRSASLVIEKSPPPRRHGHPRIEFTHRDPLTGGGARGRGAPVIAELGRPALPSDERARQPSGSCCSQPWMRKF